MTATQNHPLAIALSAAVPLHIFTIQKRGGPSDDDWLRARETGQLLAEKGDRLLFNCDKAGETAQVFNVVAHAVAVLSCCPGGITLFGQHYETRQ